MFAQPAPAAWQQLYELAAEIKALAPWEWMTETEVFGVQDPETGRLGFISVMGQLGDHFAVALYLDAEGLYGLWTMEELGEYLSAEVLLSIPQLQLSFEDRDTLTQRDRELIKSLGLRFRGRNTWPMFRSYRPGFMPWHLEAEEVRFLTLALEQALDVLPRVREHVIQLEPEDEESIDYLVRVAYRQGEGWIWEDQIMQVPPPEPYQLLLKMDEVALRRLKRLPLADATFEIDLIMTHSYIQERPEDRPKLAHFLLIVDHNSSLVLGNEVMVADPDFESMIGQIPMHIVRTMDRFNAVPRHIMAKNSLLLTMLSLLAEELDFELQQVSRLPMLEEAQSFLLGRF